MPRSWFGSSALSTNVAALYLFLLERASLRTCANHRTQPSNHIPNYLGSFGFRILKTKFLRTTTCFQFSILEITPQFLMCFQMTSFTCHFLSLMPRKESHENC